ncbi:hypothetical protein E2C01_040583 [Portunus trituberculatus]|uniref:Uncharacterized protein n=1 Tax=Portunus trituberculatus TaxID=210409 RepID=A0A5B7FP53_PORTR|nr:hypothetical protein [Portunus trituberculatus]
MDTRACPKTHARPRNVRAGEILKRAWRSGATGSVRSVLKAPRPLLHSALLCHSSASPPPSLSPFFISSRT